MVTLRVGYRGGEELVYILPQGQGGKGTEMINIHTCMHTHDVQGYIGHTTTNLHVPIEVTLLGTVKCPLPSIVP